MADKIDNIINSSVATLIGIVMLCAVVIPVGMSLILAMPEAYNEFATILKVAITMAIVGLIVGIVRYFSSNKE